MPRCVEWLSRSGQACIETHNKETEVPVTVREREILHLNDRVRTPQIAVMCLRATTLSLFCSPLVCVPPTPLQLFRSQAGAIFSKFHSIWHLSDILLFPCCPLAPGQSNLKGMDNSGENRYTRPISSAPSLYLPVQLVMILEDQRLIGL
jgi:hypothetical protein